MERKAVDCSSNLKIGFVGVLISFGLGNALIFDDENTNGGKLLPKFRLHWIQAVAGRGFLNQEDKNYITDTIGKENIKIFWYDHVKASIDGHEVGF